RKNIIPGISGQGLQELKNEAPVIAKVRHKQLVRLLGCCIDRDEKILVCDYIPNKSLAFFIFDSRKRLLLDWGTCTQIIEEIAQELLYFRQYSKVLRGGFVSGRYRAAARSRYFKILDPLLKVPVIHKDLKASNILLDKDMNPKISNFGMARIISGGNEL
ncbi:hypothetical protein CUMW_263380, partial [Citrus unshiu]